MSGSFSDVLALALPALPPELAPDPVQRSLQRSATDLAPVHRGGLEVRLGANDPRVDLQQCIVPSDGEPGRALAHLRARPAEPALAGLVERWGDPANGWHEQIAEIWLEYDRPEPGAGPAVPSVFIGLPQTVSGGSRKLEVVEGVLDVLLGVTWLPWRESLRRAFEACHDAFVSHVGVMLSRQTHTLRLNFKRLRPDTLMAHLRRVGWSADEGDLLSVALPLFDLADRVTVCLDVGQAVAPGVGFECIVDPGPEEQKRWERLLDHCVQRGWCTPGKRSALLRWPGTETPPESVAPWPDALIAESLTQPPGTLGVFERRLSHVKVVHQPGQEPRGKGYLWFGHEWHRIEQAGAPAERLSQESHLDRVRAYYDSTAAAYVDHLGTTFQGWLLGASGDPATSNRKLATRAGVEAGQLLLDAGCGVCGPALDIAGAFGVEVDAITISDVQASLATDLIRDAAMHGRVRVRAGDYHELPWADDRFDVALFLESAGQSETPVELYREMERVLKPGGRLYVKDAFKPPDGKLSPAAREDVAKFDAMFAYRTTTLDQTVEAMAAAGFEIDRAVDLTGMVTGDRWREALVEERGGALHASALGALHPAAPKTWPVFCGEVIARKPGCGGRA